MTDVLDAWGDPRARGESLGGRLAREIESHVAAWLESLSRDVGEDGERYVRRMLHDTRFGEACARHTPDLLAEVEGLAAGSGLDPDLVFALQLLDEEWAYRARTRPAPRLEKCSSAALASDGVTVIGQNMDLAPYTAGRQLLMRVASADAPAALLLTTAGMIGLVGVNAAKIAVCVNALPQLPNAPEGLPVAFVIRRLLQARSLEEAVDLVLSLPHATNQHYLIGAPGRVRSFEASAEGVTELAARGGRVLHTNHPLTAVTGRTESSLDRANSAARLTSLEARLGAGAPDVETLKAALASKDDPRHPVSREYDPAAGLIGYTTGSLVSELRADADAVTAWASLGPPSRSGYTPVSLAATP